MNKIQDKVKLIKKYIDELNSIVPNDFESYKNNLEKKAACEIYVEKIVEALTDLAFLTIKYKKLEIPEDDIDAFRILLNNKIISKESFEKISQAKGMRNIIAHEYGKIDDNIVFDSITEELETDAKKFIKELTN